MENSTMDLALSLLSILGFAWVFLRLLVTVVPLQIKEARVVNGLAKLRKQLLISGVAIMLVAFLGMLILSLSVIIPTQANFLEGLVVLMVGLLIIVAETKYAIYHQQYTPEHKAISHRIQKEMDRKEAQL